MDDGQTEVAGRPVAWIEMYSFNDVLTITACSNLSLFLIPT